MTADIIVQAFRLFVLSVAYALEIARKNAQAIDDAKTRRQVFEQAVARAMSRMYADTIKEKQQADAVDDAIDKESKKP